MGAYAEHRNCDPQVLIATDQSKSLRIDLLRDVDAKTMAGTLEDAFERNLPLNVPLGLQSQVDTFLGYFRKDLEKGDRMEATYVPGVARLPANSLLIHHGKDNRRHQWFTSRLDSFNTHICLWVVS